MNNYAMTNINFPVFIKVTKTIATENLTEEYYINIGHIIAIENRPIHGSVLTLSTQPQNQLYIDQTAEEVMALIQNEFNYLEG